MLYKVLSDMTCYGLALPKGHLIDINPHHIIPVFGMNWTYLESSRKSTKDITIYILSMASLSPVSFEEYFDAL